MDIKEFRELAKEHLLSPLSDLGFQSHEDHIFLSKNETTLALLRVRDKWSNITQQVKYLLVVRQNFLPDLEGREINGFVEHSALYPFKVNPLKLANYEKGFLKKKIHYKYCSCNLGHYDTTNIDYGGENPIHTLSRIAAEIKTRGMMWFELMTPEESVSQIRKYGNNEYIEKIWLKSYEENGF